MKKPLHALNKACLTICLLIFALFSTKQAHAQKEAEKIKTYLQANAAKHQLSANDIQEMKISSAYLSPSTGWYHIYYNQAYQSIDVYNGILNATLVKDNVEHVASNFIPDIAAKITNGKLTNTSSLQITPMVAIAKVADSLGLKYNVTSTKETNAERLANGQVSKALYNNASLSDENIPVKLYWFQQTNTNGSTTKVNLVWDVQIATKDHQNRWNAQVDANTGQILDIKDMVLHCNFGTPEHQLHNHTHTAPTVFIPQFFTPVAANSYNVFAFPLESPNHGSSSIVTSPYTTFLPTGTGPGATNGWHDDGTTSYTTTRGNNVLAKEDIDGNNENTIGTSPTSATLEFNYPYAHGLGTAPGNRDAAITNLFYWNNVIHDILYKYGFDEPSGNFQKTNLSGTGFGNDFVLADAQDGARMNNANFDTPSDGKSPRMQMFLFTDRGTPAYQPDSDFDNGIITHEYGHGWSIRLTGGPATNSCLNNVEQGGEGWSDYLGLMLTTDWSALTPTLASANIAKGVGTYVLGQSSTGAGSRNYPYSYDMANVNGLVTYAKVSDDTFSQPHGIGYIWSTILWDMTWEIIFEDNQIVNNIYDTSTMKGNVVALKLVNEGLRLQKCGPSFVDARDAILKADSLLFNSRYNCAIWKAFARRGLGIGASTGVSSNDRIVTEDFTPVNNSGWVFTSPTTLQTCSRNVFDYTATVSGGAGSPTFSWTRAAVAGISNAAKSGNTAIISETLINSTNAPIEVIYKFYLSPSSCQIPFDVKVVVNPSPVATVNYYEVCKDGTIPAGQGLVGTTSWYTTSTGGSPLVTNNIFNPVGVAGSGIANTATPISKTFYLGSPAFSCRTPATFTVNTPSVGGSIAGSVTICTTTNAGVLTLSGQTGSIVRWESSTNNFATVSQIADTTISITYTNLATTTKYRAVVKNGDCANTYSAIATITYTPVNSLPTAVDYTICEKNLVPTGLGLIAPITSYTNTITGTLVAGSPTYQRADGDNNTVFQASSEYVYYRAHTFVATTSGPLTIETIGATLTIDQYDTHFALYQTKFYPNSPSTNFLIGDNDSGTLQFAAEITYNITAGTTYILVVGTHGNGMVGGYEIQATANIFNTTPPTNWYAYSSGGTALANGNTFNPVGVAGSGITDTYTGVSKSFFIDAPGNPGCRIPATFNIISAGSVAGSTTVCNNTNSGTLSLIGHVGTIIRWESSTDNFATTTQIANTTTTLTYNNISQTTQYRVVIQNSECGTIYSSKAVIMKNSSSTETTTNYTVCKDDTVPVGQGLVSTNAGGYTNTVSGTFVAGSPTYWHATGNNVRIYEPNLEGGNSFYQTHTFTPTTTGMVIIDVVAATLTGSYIHDTYLSVYKNSFDPASPATNFQLGNDDGAPLTLGSRIADTFEAGTTYVVVISTYENDATGTYQIQASANIFGNPIKWYSSLTDVTSLGTGNVFNPVGVAGSGIPNTATQLSKTFYAGINTLGNCLVPATFTIGPGSVGGTLAGTTDVCPPTNTGTLTLSGHSGNVVRWESSTNNFATVTQIANTTATLTYNNIIQATQYRAVVKSGSCNEANSATATITITPTTVGGTIAGTAAVCAPTNIGTLTLSGHTGSIVRWESSTNNFTTVTQLVNTTATLTYSNLTQTTQYRAVVKNGSCNAVNSATATITISPGSVGGTLAGTATVCANTNTGTITLSGHTGSIVRWESSTNNFATVTQINNTTTTLTYTNLTQTTRFRAVVKNGNCNAVNSGVVAITTLPVSVGGSIAGNNTLCAGVNSGTLTLSGHTGSIIRWESSTNNFTTITQIANTTTTLNYNNLAQTTQYRAVVKYSICSAVNSATATITISPASVGGTLTGTATVCTITNTGTVTLSGHTGSVVRWESSTDNFVTVTQITNTTPTLTYNSLTQTTRYRAVVKSGLCNAVNSGVVAITVLPVSVGGSIAGSNVFCSNTNSGTLTLSGHTGSIVRWESSTNNFTTVTQIANTTTTLNYSNVLLTTQYRVVVKNSICSAVNSTIATISRTVSPPDVIGGGRCNTGVFTLSASGCTGGTINWYAGTTSTTVLGSGTSFTTPSLAATTNYYANCTLNSCASVRVAVAATIFSGTLTYTAPQAAGQYKATQITSSANVATGVNYFAGRAIILLPGFQAGSEEVFSASIGGCQ